ncbi:MAG: molybdenum cofactor guanylyltransferase, partial [Luminiphilus sp.]
MDRIAVNDVSNAVIAVAILAGGDSFRMGQDKASLSDNSPALIERQVSDLRNLSDSMPIFAGSRRYVELNVHNVRHVSDAVKSAGPLAGILQVLESVADAGLGDGYVLVVPTDSLVPPASVYRLLTDSI